MGGEGSSGEVTGAGASDHRHLEPRRAQLRRSRTRGGGGPVRDGGAAVLRRVRVRARARVRVRASFRARAGVSMRAFGRRGAPPWC